MFNLDLATLEIVATVIIIISVTAMLVFWGLKPLRNGSEYWVAGSLSYGLVYFMPLLPQDFPSASAVLTDLLLVTSSLLFLHGTRKILNQTSFYQYELSIFFLVLAFSIYSDDINSRIITFSVVTGFSSLLTAISLIKKRFLQPKAPLVFGAAIFLVYSTYHIYIATYVATTELPDSGITLAVLLASSS